MRGDVSLLGSVGKRKSKDQEDLQLHQSGVEPLVCFLGLASNIKTVDELANTKKPVDALVPYFFHNDEEYRCVLE